MGSMAGWRRESDMELKTSFGKLEKLLDLNWNQIWVLPVPYCCCRRHPHLDNGSKPYLASPALDQYMPGTPPPKQQVYH